jgi:hypothetical protein
MSSGDELSDFFKKKSLVTRVTCDFLSKTRETEVSTKRTTMTSQFKDRKGKNMANNKRRSGAVTIEYVLVLVLVIGLSASLVGFQGTLENVVRNAGTSVNETSTNVANNSASQNQTSSSLLQAINDSNSNNTESTVDKTSTSDSVTSSSSGTVNGEVSVTELYSESDDGDKTTILDVLSGLETSLDSGNDFLSSISSSVSKLSYLSYLPYLSNVNSTLATTNTKLDTIANNISNSSSNGSGTSYSNAKTAVVTSSSSSNSTTITPSVTGTYLVTLSVTSTCVKTMSEGSYDYEYTDYGWFNGYYLNGPGAASFYMQLTSGTAYTLGVYRMYGTAHASVSIVLVS